MNSLSRQGNTRQSCIILTDNTYILMETHCQQQVVVKGCTFTSTWDIYWFSYSNDKLYPTVILSMKITIEPTWRIFCHYWRISPLIPQNAGLTNFLTEQFLSIDLKYFLIKFKIKNFKNSQKMPMKWKCWTRWKHCNE